jgi:hypothetical protein
LTSEDRVDHRCLPDEDRDKIFAHRPHG